MALVGDTATQFLATAIQGTGVERGYNIDLFEAEYNQVERQFMDPTSDLYQFDADFIVVFQSTHKLGEHHSTLPQEQQVMLAEERLRFVTSICANPALASKKIIYFNYPEIEDTVFGSYANKVESSFTYQVRKLNYELMHLSQQFPNLFICDIAGFQNKFGRDEMFAANVYTSTEMILSIDALPYVASRVMDIVCAIKGQFKKCLILDLDNTVWGGVIGDDGLEGIQLGHGLGIGKAFTEFQMWVKKLKQRGIIICVASKIILVAILEIDAPRKKFEKKYKLKNNELYKWTRRGLTFVLWVIGDMIFRSATIGDFFGLFKQMWTGSGSLFMGSYGPFTTGLLSILILFYKEFNDEYNRNRHFIHSEKPLVSIIFTGLMIAYILLLGELKGASFIYFQF